MDENTRHLVASQLTTAYMTIKVTERGFTSFNSVFDYYKNYYHMLTEMERATPPPPPQPEAPAPSETVEQEKQAPAKGKAKKK